LEIKKTLDVKGLFCPIPVIKTKQIINTVDSGNIIEILATDPAAKEDIPSWAKREGHEMLKIEEENEIIKFYLRKGTSLD
tara:strand:+ start:1006 stop:1245 length:240 start_codon:yes stop_codon:yes gene_type:complete